MVLTSMMWFNNKVFFKPIYLKKYKLHLWKYDEVWDIGPIWKPHEENIPQDLYMHVKFMGYGAKKPSCL